MHISTNMIRSTWKHISRYKNKFLAANFSNQTNDSEKYEPTDMQLDEILKNTSDMFSPSTKINPEDTYAILFPGQGSQFVGMEKDLLKYPQVESMFKAASEILGYDLLHICSKGPIETLNKTLYCQPAVVITALAAIEKIQAEHPHVIENCVTTAGYSVGEYAALVFSGVLTFEDAIKLIGIRAKEMQNASDNTASGMITVVGTRNTKYRSICQHTREYCEKMYLMDDVECQLAAYLSPTVRTIAGHQVALEFIHENKKQFELRKVSFLPVSGAFHSRLMEPAFKALKSAMNTIEFNEPIITTYSNIDGKPYKGAKHIKKQLPQQIIKPVYWEQTMHSMLTRPNDNKMINVVETGPGSQLGTLLKQCNGRAYLQYVNMHSKT